MSLSLMHAGKCSLASSPVHDALQDGGEWRDADTSPDQDGMLRGEDLPGGRPVRPVHIALTSEGGVVFTRMSQRSEDTETNRKVQQFFFCFWIIRVYDITKRLFCFCFIF